ncbi:hypothetical protein K2X40_03445 [Candidatus Babeliales bacterium]|nr:hypothetical protein [Candidatus Babeliales bacterium]
MKFNKLNRLFAVVALTATLTTNNAHCNIPAICAITTAAIVGAPLQMLLKVWRQGGISNPLNANPADLEFDGNKITEVCEELRQIKLDDVRHEVVELMPNVARKLKLDEVVIQGSVVDVMPKNVHTLCALDLKEKTATQAAQAYAQRLEAEAHYAQALLECEKLNNNDLMEPEHYAPCQEEYARCVDTLNKETPEEITKAYARHAHKPEWGKIKPSEALFKDACAYALFDEAVRELQTAQLRVIMARTLSELFAPKKR